MKTATIISLSIYFCFILRPYAYSISAGEIYGINISQEMQVIETLSGNLDISQSTGSKAFINKSPTPFNGFVGVKVHVESITWRVFAHWWDISIKINGVNDAGNLSLVVRCFDKDKTEISNIMISEDISQGHKKFHYNVSEKCVGITKCNPNNVWQNTDYVILGIQFRDWKGTADILQICIDKYILDKELKDRYSLGSDNKAQIGAMPWFEPSYKAIGTASPSLRDTAHKLFAAAGINKMRFMAVWGGHFRKGSSFRAEPLFESQEDVYDFEQLDSYIDELQYYGHSIGVLTLWGTPDWSHSKTIKDIPSYKKNSPHSVEAIENATFPPDSWNDYQEFVGKMVERYKGKINAYEIWNEPDNWHYGMTFGYKSYLDYLIYFSTTAKKIYPECKIYCGRLSHWLPICFREANIQDYIDAVASHPYPGTNSDPQYSKESVEEVIKSMISCDVKKPIIVTEVGLGAGYPWPGPGGYCGENLKAQNAKKLFQLLSQYTKEIYWYTPIQEGRSYGILHYINGRYRPNPVYYVIGEFTGKLNPEKISVMAEVILPNGPIKIGESASVTLIARNISQVQQQICFWPVGFIHDLGYEDITSIRYYDKLLTLSPGQEYSVAMQIKPSPSAFGKYPIGLVIINDKGNSLALEDISIWSIAAVSKVKVSSCDYGSPQSVNSLFDPIWSGDIDVPSIAWAARPNQRKEWIEYHFDNQYEVSQAQVYWMANPKQSYQFKDFEYDTHVLPVDWRIYYKNSGGWIPVANINNYNISVDEYNTINFKHVLTDAIRLEVELKSNKKGGVLQWKIK